MKKTLTLALSLLSLGAQANIVSGPSFTDTGKAVNTQDLEWLSLFATNGISSREMMANLQNSDGWIDNFGNSWAHDDWRIATRYEVEELLFSLWGGSSLGLSTDNYDGAKWFNDNLGLTGSNRINSQIGWFHYGIGECGFSEAEAYGDATKGCEGNAFVSFDVIERDSVGDIVNNDGSLSRGITYRANSGLAGSFTRNGGVNYNQQYDVRVNNSSFNIDDGVSRGAESFVLVRGQDANYGGWGEPGAIASNVNSASTALLSLSLFGMLLMRRRSVL
tara:strand:+ start:2460 stop:3287 length:828 start_codon:yes stop_codon:yes gene_type:complete